MYWRVIFYWHFIVMPPTFFVSRATPDPSKEYHRERFAVVPEAWLYFYAPQRGSKRDGREKQQIIGETRLTVISIGASLGIFRLFMYSFLSLPISPSLSLLPSMDVSREYAGQLSEKSFYENQRQHRKASDFRWDGNTRWFRIVFLTILNQTSPEKMFALENRM